MNIRKNIRFGYLVLIVISLLFANTTSVAAGGGKGSGEVSVSVTYPPQGTDASKSLPGGGYATATAQLAWSASAMTGTAKTSLSSGVAYTYSICATATQMYKNGAPQGGAVQKCGSYSGGGSVSSKKTVYVPSVYGITWKLDTDHGVSRPGFGWYPSLTVYATP